MIIKTVTFKKKKINLRKKYPDDTAIIVYHICTYWILFIPIYVRYEVIKTNIT